MYAYMHECIYSNMYDCIIYTNECKCVGRCVYAYVYVCIYAFMNMCMYICM